MWFTVDCFEFLVAKKYEPTRYSMLTAQTCTRVLEKQVPPNAPRLHSPNERQALAGLCQLHENPVEFKTNVEIFPFGEYRYALHVNGTMKATYNSYAKAFQSRMWYMQKGVYLSDDTNDWQHLRQVVLNGERVCALKHSGVSVKLMELRRLGTRRMRTCWTYLHTCDSLEAALYVQHHYLLTGEVVRAPPTDLPAFDCRSEIVPNCLSASSFAFGAGITQHSLRQVHGKLALRVVKKDDGVYINDAWERNTAPPLPTPCKLMAVNGTEVTTTSSLESVASLLLSKKCVTIDIKHIPLKSCFKRTSGKTISGAASDVRVKFGVNTVHAVTRWHRTDTGAITVVQCAVRRFLAGKRTAAKRAVVIQRHAAARVIQGMVRQCMPAKMARYHAAARVIQGMVRDYLPVKVALRARAEECASVMRKHAAKILAIERQMHREMNALQASYVKVNTAVRRSTLPRLMMQLDAKTVDIGKVDVQDHMLHEMIESVRKRPRTECKGEVYGGIKKQKREAQVSATK